MTDEKRIAEARVKAKMKYDFYVHFAVYLAVIAILLVVNLLVSPEYLWFLWPAMGWGIALLLHSARAFFLSHRKDEIIDSLAHRELNK